MNAIIYKITNTKNNKIYVGQTKQPLNRRFKDHIRHAFNSDRPNDLNCKLYIAMREEGINHFIIEELEAFEAETRYAIDKKEIEWIAKLNSTDPEIGYNVDKGGHVISEKCRQARIRQMIGSKLEGKQLEVARENGMKWAKPVCQYDKMMNLIAEYPSVIEASRKSGCDRRTIQRQLKGESNTGSAHSFGNIKFIWRYKEVEQSNIE